MTFGSRHRFSQWYVVSMLGRYLDEVLRGSCNFTGTRVEIVGRIVTYVSAVVGRIHGDLARARPLARGDQEKADCEVIRKVFGLLGGHG